MGLSWNRNTLSVIWLKITLQGLADRVPNMIFIYIYMYIYVIEINALQEPYYGDAPAWGWRLLRAVHWALLSLPP